MPNASEHADSIEFARSFCPEELVRILDWKGESDDLFHDGAIIEIVARRDKELGKTSVVLTILGPLWDRIYKISFNDVSHFSADGLQIPPGQNVTALIFSKTETDKRCCIHLLGTDRILEVTFAGLDFRRESLGRTLSRRRPLKQ